MSKTFPIMPVKVPYCIEEMIQRYCPISQAEIVDEGDDQPTIYKYVGFIEQTELPTYIPRDYKLLDYRKGVVSLYENESDMVCVFWHENVLVVMVSTSDEQHDGVMNHYGDAGTLLKYVADSHVICALGRYEKEMTET